MSVKNNVILDLDGTLIDDSTRHYQAFLKITDIKIDKESYWRNRRKGLSNKELLKILTGSNQFDIDQFKNIIESKQFLTLDRLIAAPEKLVNIQKGSKIILCTVRSNRSNLFWQLRKLEIEKYFDDIIVLTHEELHHNADQYKSPSLSSVCSTKETDIIIGDTEIDIMTGKKLGIKTIAVLSGIRNRSFLQRYQPDNIISDINLF